MCTPILIASLFTIAQTQKQPKCPSTEECIKIWYMYTMEYYSIMKRNGLFRSFVKMWMDLEAVTQSQVRERQISYDTAYTWNLKWG